MVAPPPTTDPNTIGLMVDSGPQCVGYTNGLFVQLGSPRGIEKGLVWAPFDARRVGCRRASTRLVTSMTSGCPISRRPRRS